MTAREFLELLLPPSGVMFTASPTAKGWRNVGHRGLDAALAHINHLTFEHQAAYFALATYTHERYREAADGRWRTRTQANAQFIRAFFLDLDVEPDNPLKFASKLEALTALRGFVAKLGLPRPLLVDSGGGLHVYWPLTLAVPTGEWQPVAEQFKAICVAESFRADRSLTSDTARVLRCIGSYNPRRHAPVKLLHAGAPVAFTEFARRLADYAAQHGIATTPARATPARLPGSPPAAASQVWPGDDNLGATNSPVNFDAAVFACAQLQRQVAVRGAAVGEPLWRAGLGVVKFCHEAERAAAALSDGHAQYRAAETRAKLGAWATPPTTCAHFHQLQPATCEACPHWQTITSPVQLGRQVDAAPAPVVQLPNFDGVIDTIELCAPPTGYVRRASDHAIVQLSEDQHGNPVQHVICPYDFYPLAVRSQNERDAPVDERSLWRVHLPMVKDAAPQARDFEVPAHLLGDARALTKLLNAKGVLLIDDQAKSTQRYMSAYLQKLTREAGRQQLYERLGWHDDYRIFVLGDQALARDGTTHPHTPSKSIRGVTHDRLHAAGTLAGWQAAIAFYAQPGYEGHRMFLYAALGAPLFHMNDTGQKGVMLTASGRSGRGKTTCLKACSSLWGHPESLIINGNREGSTINALYHAIGTVHSLPFLWDDITERDADELRRFLLNIGQGQGKLRLGVDGQPIGQLHTWATIVLASANTDDISRLLSSGRDVDPHLMRLISVAFGVLDTSAPAKLAADLFLRELNHHHGHVGPLLMREVVQRYPLIQKGFIANVARVERRLNSANASAERYWSATVAAAYTGAQLARSMGLIDFPLDDDLQWMIAHLARQRDALREATQTPREQLVAFLYAHTRNTLTLSAKGAGNLDNVVRAPFAELTIRHELDAGVIYIDKHALSAYCATLGIGFRPLEHELVRDGVVTDPSARKVLGADTLYATGQLRCWKVDATQLGGALPSVTAAPVTNVVPIKAGGRP